MKTQIKSPNPKKYAVAKGPAPTMPKDSFIETLFADFDTITDFSYSMTTPITIVDGRVYKDHPMFTMTMFYKDDLVEVAFQYLSATLVTDGYAISLCTGEIIQLCALLYRKFPESVITSIKRISGIT